MVKIFKSIKNGVGISLRLLLYIIFFPLRIGLFILLKMLSLLIKGLRFSMSFKLNALYSIIYILALAITYFIFSFAYSIYLRDAAIFHEFMSYGPYLCLFTGSALISFIIFIYLGKMAAKKMFDPIQRMTNTVKTISGDKLSERLSTSGAKDELKDLAHTFNMMLDRLQVFIERQNQFVSDASHELRTPIAVIQGYIDLLDRWGKDDPKVLEESIRSIKQETESMKILVEQLLFLARSDKNTLKINKQTINLSDICHRIIKETSFIDDEHELIPKITDDIKIFADPELIKQLIRIFIDNAIKYTPESGSVTLSCVQSGKNVIVSIKDTGIGIEKKHLPHIFERFYRTEESRQKQSGGTGLGLSIAKIIISLHDAEIYVDSSPKKGSEFIIFFSNVNSSS
jgi:two-component system sensor histidine kinase ArlS